MNYEGLAVDITTFLTPFLPYLMSGAEAAVKEVGKKFGEDAWQKAKSLWGRIRSPNLIGVAAGLAEDPNDEDFQVTLAKLLTKQLGTSPELAAELMNVMRDDKAIQKVLIEQGSVVKNILQRLGKTGRQEAVVRDSQVVSITQKQ